MKRLLAILLLCSTPAFADDLTNRLGVGGAFGAAIPVLSQWVTARNDMGIGLGGVLAYGLNDRLSLRINYDNLDFEKGPARLESVTGGVGIALDPKSVWNPTLKLGIGRALPRGVPDG
ncbi:MAG: hypothetical protein HY925_00160, partial [Elusimicrobia bacterium]|nr:hypothetical protein [Elusimicrobiota bacterium]